MLILNLQEKMFFSVPFKEKVVTFEEFPYKMVNILKVCIMQG